MFRSEMSWCLKFTPKESINKMYEANMANVKNLNLSSAPFQLYELELSLSPKLSSIYYRKQHVENAQENQL